MKALDPTKTFLDLAPDGRTTELPVDADFWPALMSGRLAIAGRLVTSHDMTDGFPHWERHPQGEELLIALSGRFRVRLETAEGEIAEAEMGHGEVFVVPTGLWHRVDVLEAGRLMFVTAGEGTEHKS